MNDKALKSLGTTGKTFGIEKPSTHKKGLDKSHNKKLSNPPLRNFQERKKTRKPRGGLLIVKLLEGQWK